MRKMSLTMQPVNVIPWELMVEKKEFHDNLVVTHAALREHSSKFDSRWINTPPDPILAAVFPFLKEEPDRKNHPGAIRILMFITDLTWPKI
jgi:hypothetical protein